MNTSADRRGAALRTLEHQIGVLVRRVRRSSADRAALVHPDLNVTALTVLITLQEQGPRRATDLVELFDLDKGAVSRSVHQLLDLGLIGRSPDPADGRASLLSLSPEGERGLQRMQRIRRQTFDARLASWSEDDLAALADQLGRYNDDMGSATGAAG